MAAAVMGVILHILTNAGHFIPYAHMGGYPTSRGVGDAHLANNDLQRWQGREVQFLCGCCKQSPTPAYRNPTITHLVLAGWLLPSSCSMLLPSLPRLDHHIQSLTSNLEADTLVCFVVTIGYQNGVLMPFDLSFPPTVWSHVRVIGEFV